MADMEYMRLLIEGVERTGRYGNGYHGGRGRGRGRGRSHGCSTRVRVHGHGEQHRGIRYCYTHGNCAHSNPECENPGPDHNIAVTFVDMMGGSQNNCA